MSEDTYVCDKCGVEFEKPVETWITTVTTISHNGTHRTLEQGRRTLSPCCEETFE